MFVTVFFTVVLLIPIYALLIWSYLEPEESLLIGKRWMYREEPEISKTAIRYTKFISMTTMIFLPVMILSLVLEIYILRLVFVIFPLVMILGALRIFSKTE
jgi:hypothetical protein